MKKCKICELNYVKDENEEVCEICKMKMNVSQNSKEIDNNKEQIEKYLLPYLRKLPKDILKTYTTKERSMKIFKLRHPLLVECKNSGYEQCKKEIITDKSQTYRYYVKPYKINNEYYHICSQWANSVIDNSKIILNIIKDVDLDKKN